MTKPTVLGYMREQPERLRYVFDNRDVFTEPFVKVFKENRIQKVIFFGSGTSYNVSHLAAYYFKHITGIAAEAQYPTVFKNYEKADWSGRLNKNEILFVGISQSGTSVSTCEVMRHAKENGYHTLAITGNLESEITKHIDTKVHLLVGDELTPPETKGYTVSLLSVYLWALACALETDVLSREQYNTALAETDDLISKFQSVIEDSEAWYERNKATIVNSDRIITTGYGIDFGTVLEAQLKIGEMLRLPSLGYEMVEYSHGPTMALNQKQTVFMIGSEEAEYDQMLQFRDAFRQYSDRVHVVTCVPQENEDPRDLVFRVRTNKYLAPLMYTVPFQFVAAKGAADIGIDTGINPFRISLAHYGD